MKKILSKIKDFLRSEKGNKLFSLFVDIFYLMFVSALAVCIYSYGYDAGSANNNTFLNNNILYIQEV